jgi:hypothetical protein
MLTHVFEIVLKNEPDVTVKFVQHALGAEVDRIIRSGDFVVIEYSGKTEKWSAGRIYKKLSVAPPKIGIPVMWHLCHEYDGADETSEALRRWCAGKGIFLETVPFFFRKGRLRTECQIEKKGSIKLSGKKWKSIKINVDKNRLSVILKLTEEIGKILLRRLEEIAL